MQSSSKALVYIFATLNIIVLGIIHFMQTAEKGNNLVLIALLVLSLVFCILLYQFNKFARLYIILNNTVMLFITGSLCFYSSRNLDFGVFKEHPDRFGFYFVVVLLPMVFYLSSLIVFNLKSVRNLFQNK